MSKLNYTIIAGTVTALVAVSALAQNHVSPQDATGAGTGAQNVGAGVDKGQKGDKQVNWGQTLANQAFAIQQQNCETLKRDRNPQAFPECMGRAQAALDKAIGSGSGTFAAAGNQGMTSDPDQSMIEKIATMVMNKLSPLAGGQHSQPQQNAQAAPSSQPDCQPKNNAQAML